MPCNNPYCIYSGHPGCRAEYDSDMCNASTLYEKEKRKGNISKLLADAKYCEEECQIFKKATEYECEKHQDQW